MSLLGVPPYTLLQLLQGPKTSKAETQKALEPRVQNPIIQGPNNKRNLGEILVLLVYLKGTIVLVNIPTPYKYTVIARVPSCFL